MICVVIIGPSMEEVCQQVARACEYGDLVELRLDYFVKVDLEALAQLRQDFSVPMIFTVRSSLQGGGYSGSEESRLALIHQLAAMSPEYFDIESFVSDAFLEDFIDRYPEIILILSYHNFVETPHDLDGIYSALVKRLDPSSSLIKIAVTARSSSDALRLLGWTKQIDGPKIVLAMGAYGQVTRILAPVVGSVISYACLEDSLSSAPGQLTAQAAIELYRYRSMSPSTALYGLIGDPVEQSIGAETHNSVMKSKKLDAVYVKMQVTAAELPQFLELARLLPFRGLSVTMPLKEAIIPFLDCLDEEAEQIGAVNTLSFESGDLIGFNTDGKGALDAIEAAAGSVAGKRIVIIGAGGAAKAIIYEGCRRGALVTLLNRDAERACEVAARFNCVGRALDDMVACSEEGYDILVNCTPAGLPIDPKYILPAALVMDIKTRPKETEFLLHAIDKGCRIVYGEQMFLAQASGQYSRWFG